MLLAALFWLLPPTVPGRFVLVAGGALGLGAGVAGGMNDQALGQALKLPQANIPFLVMPVGHKQ